MCYQNYYSIIRNYNIIIASIILDKNNSAFKYLNDLKNNDTDLYKYFISLIKHNNLL